MYVCIFNIRQIGICNLGKSSSLRRRKTNKTIETSSIKNDEMLIT